MIKSIITDSRNKEAVYTSENALLVTDIHSPPLVPQKRKVYSAFLETAAGSNDMGIDGSTTAVEFYIQAMQTSDLYLSALTFVFGYGSSAELYEFVDSGAALTNGVLIEYEQSNGERVEIANPKTNFAFFRLGLGSSYNNWESRGFAAAADYGYYTAIKLSDIIPPYGIKLDRGTNQKLIATVRDDCTDADLFNIRAFGFERFE